PWMWTLYTHFDNPLFPYFNDVFRSPWWDEAPLFDRRFGPHTLLEWLGFPFRFFGYSSLFVTEVRFRDWRLGLLCVSAIGALSALVASSVLAAPFRSEDLSAAMVAEYDGDGRSTGDLHRRLSRMVAS